VDRHVLRLIKLWLKAPIEEWDEGDGTRRIGGGKGNTRDTPQGSVRHCICGAQDKRGVG